MIIRKCLLFCAFISFAFNVFAAKNILNTKFQLLPQPKEISIIDENGIMWNSIESISIEGDTLPPLGPLLSSIPQSLQGKYKIILSIDAKLSPSSKEGYILDIRKDKIQIKSKSRAGLFYGCATLEQLMQDSKDKKIAIPIMKITDYPSIDYRAVHFDTKHHLDKIEYYYRVIDKLASYKVNAVIWEIEDKLQFSRRPECSAPNAISKQEMQTLCRYAHERNIDISPLVQGLGHAGFILKRHWELRENPNSDWEFCPSEPKTYELQFDLYRDALEAMPYSKYLHVGGDEITAIGIDNRCIATGKTPFELQMTWLKKVCEFVKSQGRSPIFWDDMPLKFGNVWNIINGSVSDEELEKIWKTDKLDEAINLFPKDCIYMRWFYGDPDILGQRKVLEWYKSKGLTVMGATAASDGGSPFMPRYDSKAQNIQKFCSLVLKNNLAGILSTAWDDGSPHWETIMRGLIAQGEFGWNPNGRSIESFKKAHAQREFGFSNNQFRFVDDLEKEAFFYDGALVIEGRRNPAWQVTNYKLLALPDSTKKGEWSKVNKERLELAKASLAQYNIIKSEIIKAKNEALRNRYTLEVLEQNNEMFHFPAILLLALEKYDNANSIATQKGAINEIKQVVGELKTIQTNLEQVYSKTRFMSQPDGYIQDLNHHHHLSSLTQNSDWLFLYEIQMVKEINKWLPNN